VCHLISLMRGDISCVSPDLVCHLICDISCVSPDLWVGAIEAGRAHCRALMDQAHAAMSAAPARLRDTLLTLFEALLDRKK